MNDALPKWSKYASSAVNQRELVVRTAIRLFASQSNLYLITQTRYRRYHRSTDQPKKLMNHLFLHSQNEIGYSE